MTIIHKEEEKNVGNYNALITGGEYLDSSVKNMCWNSVDKFCQIFGSQLYLFFIVILNRGNTQSAIGTTFLLQTELKSQSSLADIGI